MFTLVSFSQTYLHIDGSTGTQSPRSQLVVYVSSADSSIPWVFAIFFFFFPNAINMDLAIIIIDIVITVLLIILIAFVK